MNIALGVLVLLNSFIAGTEPRDGSHVGRWIKDYEA
jgi:hypothetical protein